MEIIKKNKLKLRRFAKFYEMF